MPYALYYHRTRLKITSVLTRVHVSIIQNRGQFDLKKALDSHHAEGLLNPKVLAQIFGY
jgi:hypothetical protein